MSIQFFRRITHGAWLRLKSFLSNPYSELGLSPLEVKRIKHQTAGKERKIRIKGHWLYYQSPSELIHGLNEIFLEKVYAQVFGPDPYILDCGSNIGLSVIYLKLIAPDAVIDAYEPDCQNIGLLKKNLEAFGLSEVTVHQKAVWKEETVLKFEAGGQMSSRIGDQSSAGSKMIDVETVRLKDKLNRPVDFLKIDIEGAEYEVLLDAKGNLHNVKAMFVEYHGTFAQNKELVELLSLINEVGFSFYIKEATSVFDSPLTGLKRFAVDWDVQLNIFCVRH